MKPDAVMIFAAGFGTRMGKLTEHKPKPLIPVLGRPLIDYALQIAMDAGIENIVINTHYKPAVLEQHLVAFGNLQIIRETPDILETGGGLKNALPLLGDNPVFTLNSDMVWTGSNPLTSMATQWNPENMDALLMLIPKENAQENTSSGDFFMDAQGKLTRRGQHPTAPFIYSGAQIIKTGILSSISATKFSLNKVWDILLKRRTVYGVVHSGGWVDVGRPQGITVAETELKRSNDV